ncbi:MAG: hypothetical protein E7164_03655 [Firmicutes bacterium]|nr:hypothetical protein [Bacillota bacterium]
MMIQYIFNNAFSVYESGRISSVDVKETMRSVRPTLYLSSDMKVMSGNDSFNLPYILKNTDMFNCLFQSQ